MPTGSSVQAAVLHGPENLRIESRLISAVGPDDLEIAIRSTGICGSDLHFYRHYANGDVLVREPLVLGHESAGIVTAVGSSVDDFKIGDKVALEVGQPCGSCARCEEGRYNICKDMQFRSAAKLFPHAQGTLQERIIHPAKWSYKLPDNVSLDEGALLEPMGVAIQAMRRAQLHPQSITLIFGAGAVGLLCAAILKVTGSSTIVIADIEEGRVDFAVKNGFADRGFVVPRKRGSTTIENLNIAKETATLAGNIPIAGGDKQIGEFDAVFECTGVEACLQAAIYATRPGGRVLIIGTGTPVQILPVSAAAFREVDLIGVFRYANTYPLAIEIVSNKGLKGNKGRPLPDLKTMITHRFRGMQNVNDAFHIAGKGKDENGNLVLKCLVLLGGEEDSSCVASSKL
ncbi:MAG: hypothetical protein M1834_002379 [Cirrosporium novae-zelandiae]|nr:MAG: hypothetical protein M1834_002379 [Cirrosporium novae-zelandiae]